MADKWVGVVVPLPRGREYDGAKVVEIVQFDSADPYQPWLYLLDDGREVWIPCQ